MTVRTTAYPNVPLIPDFTAGEIVVGKANRLLVLVTGRGKHDSVFAGTILHKGNSDFGDIGKHHEEWLKSGFMPYRGTITLESTP